MLSKFHKQAKWETNWNHRHGVQHKSSERGCTTLSRQYLKAKSELTKLVSENYPHEISYWTNDIMTFNEKRQSVKYRMSFLENAWSATFSGLPFDQWRTMVSFRDWDHDVQKTICISTPKYFRVCKTALSIWKRGDGTRADLVRAFFPSQFCSLQEQYRSSEGFDYCNVLLSHSGLFYMWFVKEKIYLAHTLEWHTWFWQ